MKNLDVIAATLLVIGGLNWGVVALRGTDLVGSIFGDASPISRVIYVLVALAALYQALQWKAIQRRWQHAIEETAS